MCLIILSAHQILPHTRLDGCVAQFATYIMTTPNAHVQRLKDFPKTAQNLLKGRFAIIQTWRSIADQVESEPLALCDGKTIQNRLHQK